VQSTSCNATDLAVLARACRGPNPGQQCNQAFRDLMQAKPGCYDCMLQFTGSDALARCLSPYLSQTCNHQLTCAVECVQTSCDRCPGGREASCQGAVFSPSGQCGSFVGGYYCAEAAIQGPAAVCDFSRYGDLGRWWEGVGLTYCASK
jgi:hypothetical protein